MSNSRELYNLACRIEGTCSWDAIRYGLEGNRGFNKLRFLKSRVGEIWRRLKGRVRLWLCKRREQRSIKAFASMNPQMKVSDIIKPIAFYLPQFHTFPENDAWWGQGFTEWTNVKKAKSLFEGHYQPHVPHPDVGYYDLSDVEVMRRQAAMAKKYGIHGFCFYYYHFANGKRLLEKPLNNWLAAKDIDFPFCYCWANENWTRTWDGGDKEIIMPQDYSSDNIRAMFSDMLVAFKDPRYIKTRGGLPVLLVYRAEIIPNIVSVAKEWREMAEDAGYNGVYLISVQNFASIPPETLGLDAAVEFAAGLRAIDPLISFGQGGLSRLLTKDGRLLAGRPYINHVRWCERPDMVNYTRYRSVAPSWDNTPRRGERGVFMYGCSPRLFHRTFVSAARKTIADPALRDNGFLFINAWNEWGEGAHLEPDVKFGYKWLEAVLEVMAQKIGEL